MNNPNKDDEIIEVKLPRKDYETLRDILARENAYTWFKSTMRSWWVWSVAGGILSIFMFFDTIRGLFK